MSRKEDIKCDECMRGGEHELEQRVHLTVLRTKRKNNELHGKERISGFYEVSIMSTTYSL